MTEVPADCDVGLLRVSVDSSVVDWVVEVSELH